MNAQDKYRSRALLKLLPAVLLSVTFLPIGTAQVPPASTDYDPASANMAPVGGDPSQAATQPYPDQQQAQQQAPPPRSSNVQNESIQSAQQAQQRGAPAQDNQAPPQDQNPQYQDQQYQDQAQQPPTYNDNGQPVSAQEQAAMDELSADQPPPQLPTYDQPPAPDPDYMWTPGYWGYAPAGYYWVPGVWVAAPWPGALWTPGYWSFYGGHYRFRHGYWGRYVGFYGGINYGFGYTGYGFWGGYWSGPHFYYNRAITRVNVSRVTYVYSRPVVINRTYANNSRIAYTGGPHGLQFQPRPAADSAAA
jgi:hypothetical protein